MLSENKHTKTIPKGHILYNSIYGTFLNKQNYRNRKHIGGYQGLRRGQGRREMAVAIKRQREAFVREVSVF